MPGMRTALRPALRPVAIAATAVATLAAVLAAQDQPIFRGGINFVRVDVIVTDNKGNAVSDLQQGDFEVWEDNKPQKVETFKLVKIDTVTQPSYTQRGIRSRNDEETAAQDENSRIFVFFLDDYNTRKMSSLSVRKPVIDFINNQLSPSDLIAVMYPLTPIDAVVLTRNHQGVINTIEHFEGRKFDYEPKNELEAAYVYKFSSQQIEMIRRQVSMTAIRGISQKLGSLREGRKSIILISEGYTALLPPQMQDMIGGIKGSGNNPARNDPFAGDANDINSERAKFLAATDMQQELKDVYEAANRNNTSIYAVDPRGLSTGEFDISENISQTTSNAYLNDSMGTLRDLANNTDGRAIVNRNDLAEGMKQIIRDSSAYYLVGYTSTPAPTDGKFHEIKVKVKRPGVQVRARRVYWAYTNEDVARATAGPNPGPPPAVTKALAAIAPMTNHRLIRTWIGTARGENGMTKVTFLWEPLPASPGLHRDEARRVTLFATSGNSIVYRAKVPADLAALGAGAATTFDAKPGKLELKITIEGDGTGTLDSEDRAIDVPDLTAPELYIDTPRVWFARNAREFQALTASEAATPSATRDFRRTDRLLIRFDVFAPGTSTAEVTTVLLNQAGTKMADVTAAPPAAAGKPYVIDLPLANLAAAEYLLEISAKTEGHEPVKELVAFRVGQ